ncbi:hypothetical protein D3C80_1682620 [compost metagenome]
MDRRAAVAFRALLELRVQLALQALPDAALGARMLAQLQAQPAPAPELPSLDEFAEGFAEDMFSEKELIALYQEQMKDQAPPAGPSPTEILRGRLDAIAWVP